MSCRPRREGPAGERFLTRRRSGGRQDLLKPWLFRLWLCRSLPLAAFAGLKVRQDWTKPSCEVSLPGGWRTRNPFRSTYFAAQAMAAEMSTGAPASLLVLGHAASVAMLVTGVPRAAYTKKIVGESVFTFSATSPRCGKRWNER